MQKTITELQKPFESSSSCTPEYLAWHRLFKREFNAFLKKYGSNDIQISKPNHFDVSGFFKLKDGQSWWFRIEDIRWSKSTMLIRTAKDFKDYTGGHNRFLRLNSIENFTNDFINTTNP